MSKTSRMLLAADLGVPEASLAVVPEAPDPVFGPRSAEEIERELTPLGLGGERFLVYAGGDQPAQGPGDAARRLRDAERAGAAPRRSPARWRTRPSCRRPARFGGRSPSSGFGEPRTADRLRLRRDACLPLRGVDGVRIAVEVRGLRASRCRSRCCRNASRAQRHPRPSRDAGRRGVLLPIGRRAPPSPSNSTSVIGDDAPTRRARRGSAATRGRSLLGRFGRGAPGRAARGRPWLSRSPSAWSRPSIRRSTSAVTLPTRTS